MFKHSLIAVTAAAAALPALAQEVVKIGHVAPITGPQGHYGKDNENGVRMAIDDLNAKGITIGGKKVKFELAAEDDAADPRQGTAAAQKMCDQKVNGVVGHLNSGTTIPASRVYNDCGIPHITPAATNPKLTQNGYKTTFRIIANDNALGAGLAIYAANVLKVRKVAVIDDRTAYGQGLAEVFKKTALGKGIQVVREEFTSDKSVDFSAVLTSVKSSGAEAVFFGGMDPQAGPMLRQMTQLGMAGVKYLGGDGICTNKIVELAGSAAVVANVVCAEGGTSIEKMPGGKAWKERYDKRFPGQFQVYSPYAYDAAMVLVEAMALAGSAKPKDYLPQLQAMQHKGVTGTIAFESNGELRSPDMTLYSFKDGKKTPMN